MNRILIILLFSYVVLFCSCEGDILPPQQSQMVVEGWIEDGGHPVVMLTSTVPVSEQETSIDSLGQYLIRWARVAVSDGERTVVLSGKYTKDYFPPYIYTTLPILSMLSSVTMRPASAIINYSHASQVSLSNSILLLWGSSTVPCWTILQKS